MNLEIFETAQAVRDFIEAADWVAQVRSLDASETFMDVVKDTYDLIASMPYIGVARDYNNPQLTGMRMLPVPRYPKYLLFYTLTDEQVTILRVLHSSRNIQEIFTPEE